MNDFESWDNKKKDQARKEPRKEQKANLAGAAPEGQKKIIDFDEGALLRKKAPSGRIIPRAVERGRREV